MSDLPTVDGGFKAIFADPPWSFKQYSDVIRDPSQRRDVQRHYQTMTPAEICGLPVASIAARDAHLFLWTTGPRLRVAFDVIEAWGFRYSAIAFVWVKMKRSFDPRQLRVLPSIECDLHVGLGFTTRKNVEIVLLARRGRAKRVAKDVREVIMAPVREHSRKPDEAYARVERYCAGPYLELFARQSRSNWTTWGDQKELFDGAQNDAPHLHRPVLPAQPAGARDSERVHLQGSLASGGSAPSVALSGDQSQDEENTKRPKID